MSSNTTLQERFAQFEAELNDRFVERSDVIHALTLALISKSHIFLLGEPGVAKSAILNSAAQLIDLQKGEYFSYLLTAFSTLDELVGNMSLKALTEEDVMRRQSQLKLPEAKLANLEEIFHSSSATLNCLLTMLNEGVWFNPGPTPAALSTLLCSSNRLPDDDTLNALADRLLLWLKVDDISTIGAFIQMLTTEHEPITPIMSWVDVEQAQAEAAMVKLPTDVAESVAVLRENLHHHGLAPSPRRFKQSIDLIKAEAWLDGRDVVRLSDCRPLRWTMWQKIEDIPVVERMVLEIASDLDKVALQLRGGLEELLAQIEDAKKITKPGEPSRQRVILETHGKLLRAQEEITELTERYVAENDTRSAALKEITSLQEYIARRLDADLVEPEAVKMRKRIEVPPSF